MEISKVDQLQNKAFGDGYDEGSLNMYQDIDAILRDAVANGDDRGYLLASGVLHKIRILKDRYGH